LPCLRYVAERIKAILPSFEIPYDFQSVEELIEEEPWSIIQAQNWEKQNYREKYLNHIFVQTEEQKELNEIELDEQERKEEKLVRPTSLGILDKKNLSSFNLINSQSRDSRIKFYPEPHIYLIDDIPAPSASTIISKFFPEFDSKYWATKKAPALGMTAKEVEMMWKAKGLDAAKHGTFLHEQIENYFLGEQYIRTPEFHLFESFLKENFHISPFRTEWRIFDEKHHIAGTVDLISWNQGRFEMYDWKRSKKVIAEYNGEPITLNPWQKGIGKLSDIDDTQYNHYCLQQSLYKYILEKNYEIKISNMFLVVIHPDYDKYYKVEVPYLKSKIEYILKSL
jgi:hypothetical protein